MSRDCWLCQMNLDCFSVDLRLDLYFVRWRETAPLPRVPRVAACFRPQVIISRLRGLPVGTRTEPGARRRELGLGLALSLQPPLADSTGQTLARDEQWHRSQPNPQVMRQATTDLVLGGQGENVSKKTIDALSAATRRPPT